VNQLLTTGIVLSRTDYGEADRILTLLTPDYGKLSLMAKGVRRIKSKLAGGIELFSVSDVTFIKGKGDMGTLVSARLRKHYGTIVQDINRTMLGYDLIKMLNKVTEDNPEAEYFQLLEQAFEALDDAVIGIGMIRLWFSAQLLRLGGHTPNLQTNTTGQKLVVESIYNFEFDTTSFIVAPGGGFGVDEIKFLRLVFANNQPNLLQKVENSQKLVDSCLPLVTNLLKLHVRV
jgi:DNA repair protein RecO (recombination protein O)